MSRSHPHPARSPLKLLTVGVARQSSQVLDQRRLAAAGGTLQQDGAAQAEAYRGRGQHVGGT